MTIKASASVVTCDRCGVYETMNSQWPLPRGWYRLSHQNDYNALRDDSGKWIWWDLCPVCKASFDGWLRG